MKLHVLLPIVGDAFTAAVKNELADHLRPDTVVEVTSLEHGPASIESFSDVASAVPGVVEQVTIAAAEGADAVFVSCFLDPGIAAARQVVDIPVVGGFEPCALTAMGVADRFSILSPVRSELPVVRYLARMHGFESRLASVRAIDVPVLDLVDRERAEAQLLRGVEAVVEEDGTEAVVLGCTVMLDVASTLEAATACAGVRVPVIDPTPTAVAWLENLVGLGLRPSRRTYMAPPPKRSAHAATGACAEGAAIT